MAITGTKVGTAEILAVGFGKIEFGWHRDPKLKALDPLRAGHSARVPDAAAGAHPLDTAGFDDAFAASERLFRKRDPAEILERIFARPPLPCLRRRANPVQQTCRILVVSDNRVQVSRPEPARGRMSLQGGNRLDFGVAGVAEGLAGFTGRRRKRSEKMLYLFGNLPIRLDRPKKVVPRARNCLIDR